MHDSEMFYCGVGVGRSRTNILGEMLSCHPMLAYGRRPKYIGCHGNAWKSDDFLCAADATVYPTPLLGVHEQAKREAPAGLHAIQRLADRTERIPRAVAEGGEIRQVEW